MTANYYRNAHAVILVYDTTDEDSLYRLNEWVAEARRNSRWADRLAIALWGNKCDVKDRKVKDETIAAFLDKHSIDPSLEFKVSSRKVGTIEEAMKTLIEYVEKRFLGSSQDGTLRDISILADGGGSPVKKACCAR